MIGTKIDDIARYKFLSGVQHAPNGEYACFVVHQGNLEDNEYQSNIWLYKTKEDKYIRLTGLDKETSYIWLKDNETILFPALRDEKDKEKKESGEAFTQYYQLNIHGGEAQKSFRIPKSVHQIKQIDPNTFIFTAGYNATKKDVSTLDEEEKKKELKKRKEEKDYEVLDEIPFWTNGKGFSNKDRNRLYLYYRDTEKIEALTGEDTTIGGFNLSEDQTQVVYTATTYKDKMPLTNKVYLQNLASKEVREISPDEDFSYGYVNFITEDQVICTGKDHKSYGLNENPQFHRIDINTRSRTNLTPDFDRSIGNSVGSDCRYGGSVAGTIQKEGDHVYFTTTEGYSSYLNRIDTQGNMERIIETTGTVDDYSVKGDSLLFIGLRGLKLQELYKQQGKEETALTDFNQWVEKERKLSTPEALTVKTAEGVEIDGWVMRPVDFDEKKKYPGILNIHGGPKTVYGENFFHEMQYWAGEGYVVFFSNPRGGDGKGNKFADIRGKYGTIDYEDLMKFTDEVLEKYNFIDENRVGVTGGSYGGFMTNWIIGHTHRFKAAASQRSISNWISKFNTTDIGYFFVEDQNQTTPWEDHEKIWEQSPLKYANKVKTPTLFIHAEEDYRCWVVEGLQMFTALKYHGVDARMCMFRDENHELSRSGKPKHRVRRLKEITDWFDHYLRS
ncbi:alpha/beta hydrolase family protein [Isachenkonia alkalipeptolytica]|uniref:S9 family peptidase n=1 Tax=Isachenkonia alkalipeptolytica TaxID=2565777 RepID=A0AA44BDB6_9CLOT|nr:S9 family peptidase [Isachenkonia alkalipeptolytica]NBG87777.1 S9 family peptidase [Isachenkonia alkalipeptolytica]